MAYNALVRAEKTVTDIPVDTREELIDYIDKYVNSGQLGGVEVLAICEVDDAESDTESVSAD